MLTQQCHRRIQLRLRNGIGTGQDDGGGRFNLVVVELAKVLHIDLNLACIRHRYSAAQNHIFVGYLFHSGNHIGQLAHTGGLNYDPVGMIALNDLCQSLSEIAHQTAANAAGIHLRNVDARILQETTVNADLTKLIFDEHQLLTAIGLLNHFLDQRGLTGTKEPGVDIDFSHNVFTPSKLVFMHNMYANILSYILLYKTLL